MEKKTEETQNKREEANEFIVEQYTQLNAHRNQVNAFSGQIPAIIFASLILSLGLKSDFLDDWEKKPQLPAISLLFIGTFLLSILWNHTRNLIARRWLDGLIQKMELKYGMDPDEFDSTDRPTGKWWWQRKSSAAAMSWYLLALGATALIFSARYWYKYYLLLLQ